MAIRPAVTNTIGIPLNEGDISLYSIFSLRPAKITIAIVNPIAVPNALTIDWIKLYSFWTLIITIPRTAQFVVISGRYTPKALYKAGLNFFKNISTNWTNAAINKINTIVSKYSTLNGTRITSYTP